MPAQRPTAKETYQGLEVVQMVFGGGEHMASGLVTT